jgi:Heparinase II/III-like protein/Heparinase II/III N-terminus
MVWQKQWAQLRSMGVQELALRLRQQVTARVDVLRYRNRSTNRTHRVSGTYPLARFFFLPGEVPHLCRLLRQRLPDQNQEIFRRSERICSHRFDLLGYEDLQYGPIIDWHRDLVHNKRAPCKPWYKIRFLDFEEVGDSKVIWELNRHQHLVTLAKAYRLGGNPEFANELFRQWRHWHASNPYPFGINWASSLEVAFRCISWIWVYFLLAETDVVPPGFRGEWLQALKISGRHIETYLSTYFSPNTHLLGEAVALFFIGALCPELPEAARWQKRGWKIVLNEAERQVKADGVHFEQSTYYHVYALDFFLHAALLAARNDLPIPAPFERTIERMLEALLWTSQAGIALRYGDDDGGRMFDGRRNRTEHMLDPLATGAVLFGRADFKAAAGELREETLWLLGGEGAGRFDEIGLSAPNARSIALPDSGLYLMAAEGSRAVLAVDAGPQGSLSAGHGHADALSIQLIRTAQALLTDPGTGEYVGPAGARDRFRVTAAHNTLQVDGQSQSRPTGPFSWLRLTDTHVEQWHKGENFDLFSGWHDGYNPVVHRRWVFYRKPDFWLVRDLVEGEGRHHAAIHWHFAPGTVQSKAEIWTFVPAAGGLAMELVTGNFGWHASLSDGEYSPAYGVITHAPVLELAREAALPFETATVLEPSKAAKPAGQLTQIKAEPEGLAVGYCYSNALERHSMFFGRAGQRWSLEEWSSNAEFLYVREDRSHFTEIIFCFGSYVSFRGQPVVSAVRRVKNCELMGVKREVLSDEKDIVTLFRWPEKSASNQTRLAPAIRSGS